ncbi:uncharacterized protein LOC106997229 isoform X2 [Macaca mulatta]
MASLCPGAPSYFGTSREEKISQLTAKKKQKGLAIKLQMILSLFFSLGLTLELHEELLDSTVTDEQLSPDAQRPAWLADGSSKAGFCRNRRLLEEESELQQVAPRRIHSGSCPARHGISVKEA